MTKWAWNPGSRRGLFARVGCTLGHGRAYIGMSPSSGHGDDDPRDATNDRCPPVNAHSHAMIPNPTHTPRRSVRIRPAQGRRQAGGRGAMPRTPLAGRPEPQTCQRANVPTCQRANVPTCKRGIGTYGLAVGASITGPRAKSTPGMGRSRMPRARLAGRPEPQTCERANGTYGLAVGVAGSCRKSSRVCVTKSSTVKSAIFTT
jgi:hypothetical protein